jgi:hypothetical protein
MLTLELYMYETTFFAKIIKNSEYAKNVCVYSGTDYIFPVLFYVRTDKLLILRV